LENKVTRKIFFEKTGKASLFIGLTSILPIKLLSSKKKFNKKIKIGIHPSAVKRINKV